MSIKIRLRRMGNRNRPAYRFVVADSRSRRDGRFLEMVGHYDPLPDPQEIVIDEERVFYWMNEGAQLSDTVRSIFRKRGLLDRWKGKQAPVSREEQRTANAQQPRTTAASVPRAAHAPESSGSEENK